MAHILLLRAPQDNPDKYEAASSSVGLIPHSIPVLETVLVNQSKLKDILEGGPQKEGIDGVIITSARACEAWSAAVQSLDPCGTRSDGGWLDVPFYVVGSGTAYSLSSIAARTNNSRFAPRDVRGAESGTAERLANFILGDSSHTLPSSHRDNKQYLFLIGDKNRDTLPTILSAGGVKLKSIMVYETGRSSKFSNELAACLSRTRRELQTWWIVYFAPSAAEFVTPILRAHFELIPADDPSLDSPTLSVTSQTQARVAAIGPTTSNFLRESLNIHVHVVSPKPTPEALAAAIKSFEETDHYLTRRVPTE